MSREVENRAIKLYEEIKDSLDPEKIKQLCIEEKEWLKNNFNLKSMGTKLSDHYTKKFKNIEKLELGKNAYIETKQDGSKIIKHLFFKYGSLTPSEWEERNRSEKVTNRLENWQTIPVKQYLEVTGKLLLSNDTRELVVGLIAATGRRVVEAWLTAKFKEIPEKEYAVMFSGQAKKRGKEVTYEIPVLFPAKFIVRRLNYLRKQAECKELKKLSRAEVDSLKNSVTNKIVREIFNPFMPKRFNEITNNCKALRAAYACLAVNRDDRKTPPAYQMLSYAKILGHMQNNEDKNDKNLTYMVTSLGYGDYNADTDVPLTEIPKPPLKEKTTSVRIFEKDLETFREYQDKWGGKTQAEVFKMLLEKVEKYEKIEIELLRKKEDDRPSNTENTQQKEDLTEEKDYSTWTSEELKGCQIPGSAYEKLLRTYHSLKNYNTNIATEHDARWYIGTRVLQDLSGSNYKSVKDFVSRNSNEIDTHNKTYELGQYHNKRHGKKGTKITDVIEDPLKPLV